MTCDGQLSMWLLSKVGEMALPMQERLAVLYILV